MVTSVIFRLNQLDVQPGQRVLLRNVTWDEFEQILDLDAIPRFLAQSLVDGEIAAVKAFRYWVRDQLTANS